MKLKQISTYDFSGFLFFNYMEMKEIKNCKPVYNIQVLITNNDPWCVAYIENFSTLEKCKEEIRKTKEEILQEGWREILEDKECEFKFKYWQTVCHYYVEVCRQDAYER